MMAEPKWEDLDKKEKQLCSEQNIKPEDYLTLKRKIIELQVKNKAITLAIVTEKGKEIKHFRDKIPVIYDFWVKTNLI